MTNRFRESQSYVDYQTSSEDLISERVCQLKSLLTVITGEGFDSFARYNDDIQSNVLWLAKAMADDITWHVEHPDEHLQGGEK